MNLRGTLRRWAIGGVIAGGLTLHAAPKPASKPVAPPKAAPPKAAEESKEAKEPMGQVDGIEIPRPGGTFLGLQVVNNNFVLTFYDAKKHKVAADVSRATARWSVKYQPNDERVLLSASGDEAVLTSPKTVKPPHVLKVRLGLFAGDGEEAVESYVVDYHD